MCRHRVNVVLAQQILFSKSIALQNHALAKYWKGVGMISSFPRSIVFHGLIFIEI